MRGPFAVWLRNAELCENTLKLQEMFSFAREPRTALARVDDSRRRAFRHRAVCLVHPRAPRAQGSVSRPRLSQPSASAACRISPVTTNGWFTTSRRSSTPPERCPTQATNAAWRCSANRVMVRARQRDRLLLHGRHDAQRLRRVQCPVTRNHLLRSIKWKPLSDKQSPITRNFLI